MIIRFVDLLQPWGNIIISVFSLICCAQLSLLNEVKWFNETRLYIAPRHTYNTCACVFLGKNIFIHKVSHFACLYCITLKAYAKQSSKNIEKLTNYLTNFLLPGTIYIQ